MFHPTATAVSTEAKNLFESNQLNIAGLLRITSKPVSKTITNPDGTTATLSAQLHSHGVIYVRKVHTAHDGRTDTTIVNIEPRDSTYAWYEVQHIDPDNKERTYRREYNKIATILHTYIIVQQ